MLNLSYHVSTTKQYLLMTHNTLMLVWILLTKCGAQRELGYSEIWECVTSVSYTHLDVYKRQLLKWPTLFKHLGVNFRWFYTFRDRKCYQYTVLFKSTLFKKTCPIIQMTMWRLFVLKYVSKTVYILWQGWRFSLGYFLNCSCFCFSW